MFRKIHWKASESGHIQKVEPKTRYVQWDLRPETRDAYDTWEPKRGALKMETRGIMIREIRYPEHASLLRPETKKNYDPNDPRSTLEIES